MATAIERQFELAGIEPTAQMIDVAERFGADVVIQFHQRYAVPDVGPVFAKIEREHRALVRFRQAMRRHEKRARRMGATWAADTFADVRVGRENVDMILFWRGVAVDNHEHRNDEPRKTRWLRDAYRQRAWLYERAADAVRRYRAEVAAP